MASVSKSYLAPERYLEIERQAERKSEYFRGEMFAMAGASPKHNRILINLIREFSNGLRRGPCLVYSNDLRVLVARTGLYTYPDLVVTCGQPEFLAPNHDTLLNPSLIVEVLSPSTETYDRGTKFAHYRNLSTLTDYLLVAQDQVRVEHHYREGDDWMAATADGPEGRVALPSIGVELSLADIYEKVDFAAPRQPGPP